MLLSCRSLPGLVNRRAVHLEPVAARYYGVVHHACHPKFTDIGMPGLQTWRVVKSAKFGAAAHTEVARHGR
jgi:hypothetical protein